MTTKLWRFWILLLLATWNNHWAAVEMNGEQRHDAGSGAAELWGYGFSKYLTSKREQPWAQGVLHSVSYASVVVSYNLTADLKFVKSKVCRWLREQNMTSMILWPTEVIMFVRNSAFSLHDVRMRWIYGKFSTTVSRHLLIKVVNIIFLCPRLPLCCL